MYGLKKEELGILQKSFSKYPSVKEVILYGSRAVGNYKEGSDIDMVIIADDSIKDKLFYIYDELEEELPYFIDIALYNTIKNEKLKQHIKNFGKTLYQKDQKSKI